jgi:hypothetical protein
MAPMAAAAAATKNNEQKIHRHRDGVNVDGGFEFVIIEVAGGFGLVDRERTAKPRFLIKTRRTVKLFRCWALDVGRSAFSAAFTLQRFNPSTMYRVTSAARFLIEDGDRAVICGLRVLV